ncbi:MAG: DUF1722 domain-containing protein [Deltaproteobacteria bacterium]|nr:DUF1722 domain-containing protein [Deltaproteobacteria bacterium]
MSGGTAVSPEAPIRIGISSCLLGERVRFDGGHKRDAFLVETFGRYVDWVPVCPEVEVGLGVPRESLQLRRIAGQVRMVTTETGIDHTEAMRRYSQRRVAALAGADLCGYVLKKNSPSCGVERVKIYGHARPIASGRGLFAEALRQAFPHLPVEEEGRLNNPQLRENFIERVFAYRRLRALFGARWTIGGLAAFHSAHKLQLTAHSPRLYTELGQLVTGAKALPRPALRASYEAQFMRTLARTATTRRQVSVLQGTMKYFTSRLEPAALRQLRGLVAEYGSGRLPPVVPLALVRHYAQQFSVPQLQGQTYLEPDPQELMLRNHV